MADQLREEFSDADLLCSSSSFEESSGMSDVEDETGDVLFHPMNSGIQPYQFEPERLDESTSTNSESDGEEFVNDDWFVAFFLFFFFVMLFGSHWKELDY